MAVFFVVEAVSFTGAGCGAGGVCGVTGGVGGTDGSVTAITKVSVGQLLV
jgi:hypothetical protein